jgi:DNA-binding response OmpR family regulator
MACTSLTNGLLLRQANSSTAQGELSKEAMRDVIEMGDFQIDVAERRATLCGRELDLTSAEFEVLVFLAGHPRSFVTPQTMLATNWKGGQIRQAEFLRALMSLTKKLNCATGSTQQYIRTEPWIFYRFDPSSG